jgi:hypothetical protein
LDDEMSILDEVVQWDAKESRTVMLSKYSGGKTYIISLVLLLVCRVVATKPGETGLAAGPSSAYRRSESAIVAVAPLIEEVA